MTHFIQLHLLTAYPPANLNRDDTGRPKTAMVGGVQRLRVSSQALKRAYRASDLFRTALQGNLATRTKRLGSEIIDHLVAEGAEREQARDIAERVAGLFGKSKTDPEGKAIAEIEQLAFISDAERTAAFELARRIQAGEEVDTARSSPLSHDHRAADIAMFGRMLADAAAYNVEAAVQVAHAFTTHRVEVEDDYFTAVDDLKDPRDESGEEERGAAHIGVNEFGSGLFYLYICIDRDSLVENLSGDAAVAGAAIAALAEAAATVSPTGKRATFASNARAHYIRAERGSQQPRTLAAAFFAPVVGDDVLAESSDAMERWAAQMDGAYGPCADDSSVMDVRGGKGSLREIVEFVSAP